MTREEAKQLLPVIQAFAEGKDIQYIEEGKWFDITGPYFNLPANTYRIKPEPKYRPFKSQEECWNEMLKHQPFGWIYSKNESCYYCIISVDENKIELSPTEQSCSVEPPKEYYLQNSYVDFVTVLEDYEYTFADGIPFGIKEDLVWEPRNAKYAVIPPCKTDKQ